MTLCLLYSCICKFENIASPTVKARKSVKMKKPECLLLWHNQVMGGVIKYRLTNWNPEIWLYWQAWAQLLIFHFLDAKFSAESVLITVEAIKVISGYAPNVDSTNYKYYSFFVP